MAPAIPSATGLLLWSLFLGAGVQLLLWRWSSSNTFSPIFGYLLKVFDGHGNALLLGLAALAFVLRKRAGALVAIRFAAERPWTVAGAVFPVLCIGSLRVYHDYPLSMDEYAALFQAKVFAAGKTAGAFPPDLLDWLIPPFFQNVFLSVSRASGEVTSSYWPGYSLLLAPAARLDMAWMVNPAIAALAVPAVHRLTQRVADTKEAAGWAVALTLASPCFVVASISYYSMQAHLLANLLYAILLLTPSVPRAFAAGLVGSVALTLHQPVPHLLVLLPFALWLLLRPGSLPILAALAAGYLPLSLLLGLGWQQHLIGIAATPNPAALASAAPSLLDMIAARVGLSLSLPGQAVIEARIAGLSKAWSWSAVGLLVLAAYGCWVSRTLTQVRLLGAALATTFLGYLLFAMDQGHGWGYRYLHSAWFVLPVLGAVALGRAQGAQGAELRAMAAWAIVLSLVAANALRLIQVDAFISRHLAQVPPLARPADPKVDELVFVDLRAGFYTQDMVQNDPFLRAPRITMVHAGEELNAKLVSRRFPGYVRSARGNWGEIWTKRRAAPSGQ